MVSLAEVPNEEVTALVDKAVMSIPTRLHSELVGALILCTRCNGKYIKIVDSKYSNIKLTDGVHVECAYVHMYLNLCMDVWV